MWTLAKSIATALWLSSGRSSAGKVQLGQTIAGIAWLADQSPIARFSLYRNTKVLAMTGEGELYNISIRDILQPKNSEIV